MMTIEKIAELLPASSEVAEFISTEDRLVTDKAVRAWFLKDRRSIPGKYWSALVRLGQEKGISQLTYENLGAAHQRDVAE